VLLGAASQRVEFLLMEWFGNEWMQSVLADWKRRERGSLPGVVEFGCITYVISECLENIFYKIKHLKLEHRFGDVGVAVIVGRRDTRVR